MELKKHHKKESRRRFRKRKPDPAVLMLGGLHLEEKAALLSGKSEWETMDIPRLDIPSLVCSDGPNGVRRQIGAGDHLGLHDSLPATCFPTASALANSWDPALAEAVGRAIGTEAAAQGVDLLLAPGLNLKRSPLCGRNFEYFSEDPYLSGMLAAGFVRGVQSKGVSACLKHFAVNSQELRRMSMNAVVDARTLRELYLRGFELALEQSRPAAVMTSYNRVNGIYANESPFLLRTILRKTFGFHGIVVTDWGASNDHVRAVFAGSDLEMPGSGFDSARALTAAVRRGVLPERALDTCTLRMLRFALMMKRRRTIRPHTFEAEKHHALSARAAAESIVLLKNENDLLPLKPGNRVALIGAFGEHPRIQGTGSSGVNPTKVESLLELLQNEPGIRFAGYEEGYALNASDSAGEREERVRRAVALAGEADAVIYCFGLTERMESESLDRKDLKISEDQTALLHSLAAVNPHIVGVLFAGAPVEMEFEDDLEALLDAYLSGQAAASALADLLTGRKTPCGKLNESIPLRYADTPAVHCFPSPAVDAEYREGLFVGYRYHETIGQTVRHPFGFGLSYTTFSYRSLCISRSSVSFVIENTGDRPGAEIAQLYIGKADSRLIRPKRELKGFCKVFLRPGEQKRMKIPFDAMTFCVFDPYADAEISSDQEEQETGQYVEEPGIYQIEIGASSEDIRLWGEIRLLTQTGAVADAKAGTEAGTDAETSTETDAYAETEGRASALRPLTFPEPSGAFYACKARLPHYASGHVQSVTDEEFETLLGHARSRDVWRSELSENDTIGQLYYAKSASARMLGDFLIQSQEKKEARGEAADVDMQFLLSMPFRALAKLSHGQISMEMVRGIVRLVNGHPISGWLRIAAGYLRNLILNRQYQTRLSSYHSIRGRSGRRGFCGGERKFWK